MSRMISARLSRMERETKLTVDRFVVSADLPDEGLEGLTQECHERQILTEAGWVEAYCERSEPTLIS